MRERAFAYDRDIKSGSLPNKVRALEIPIPHASTVACNVFIKTGARNEEVGKDDGLSHMVEHMVYRGTKNYPNHRLWAKAADHMGPDQNASTESEYTEYYMTVSPEYAQKSLALLGELIVRPVFPSGAVAREKKLILKEIDYCNDDFGQQALGEFESLLFDGTAMANQILGEKDRVLSYTRRDVRKYKEKWYRGANVLVVVTGKIGRLRPAMEENFGGLPEGELAPFLGSAGYGEPGKVVRTITSTDQAYFAMGVPGVPLNDDRLAALQVASVILGGDSSTFSSRLYDAVQSKKGDTYDLFSFVESYCDTGYFVVQGSVATKLLPEMLDSIRRQMFRLALTVTREEVIRAKKFLKGNLKRELEVTLNVSRKVGIPALIYDRVTTPSQIIKNIDSVRLDDVRRVAGEILKQEEERLVVVGPVNDKLRRIRKFNPK